MLEKAGIPGIAIITDAFDSTAKEMAELWGVPDFEFLMMPHPLASLTPDDVDNRADELIERVLGLLKRGQSA